MMRKQDFNFNLPEELIAQYPLANRSDSKMLYYRRDAEKTLHLMFTDLVDNLLPGDLLVMNDSRVIPARLFGHKTTGGKVELLVERILSDDVFLAHVKTSKSVQTGAIFLLNNKWSIEILGRKEDLYHCRSNGSVDTMLAELGHIPLPPYITRNDDEDDVSRYQTIYAKHNGSVAAPTAGLHFDNNIVTALVDKGVNIAYVTLHVGAGTFRPVRCDNIFEHKMHCEHFTVSEELLEAVKGARAAGGRVIAVGTTALRSLESAALHGELRACSHDTDIFIYPGFVFKVCDGLITNFHLPESTLLMLVSAFIGYDNAMALYKVAIENNYRFFSYGDVSLLL